MNGCFEGCKMRNENARMPSALGTATNRIKRQSLRVFMNLYKPWRSMGFELLTLLHGVLVP
jgi:hypothetical protein